MDYANLISFRTFALLNKAVPAIPQVAIVSVQRVWDSLREDVKASSQSCLKVEISGRCAR